MDWLIVSKFLIQIQHITALIGILIILSGIIISAFRYIYYLVTGILIEHNDKINTIRLNFGRILILGLEFIVAADLISTITTPDYYSIGIVAIIVAIRTLLSFSLNKEIATLSKK